MLPENSVITKLEVIAQYGSLNYKMAWDRLLKILYPVCSSILMLMAKEYNPLIFLLPKLS